MLPQKKAMARAACDRPRTWPTSVCLADAAYYRIRRPGSRLGSGLLC